MSFLPDANHAGPKGAFWACYMVVYLYAGAPVWRVNVCIVCAVRWKIKKTVYIGFALCAG